MAVLPGSPSPAATGGGGGVQSVTAADTTITVAGTASAPTVARAAITGDVAVPAGSDSATLASVITAGGPTGAAGTIPVITWDAKGRLTAVTTAGTVGSVAAASTAVVIGGTATAPTIDTASLDVIAAQHATAGSVAMNGNKLTGLGAGSAATDSASIGNTETLTNKRVTKRVTAVAGPGATPTINSDNVDVAHFTALAAAITSMTTNLSGTPVDGDTLRISFTDNGTARAITWGAKFEASTVALPTTTVINARLDVGFVWNTETSKWRCVAVA